MTKQEIYDAWAPPWGIWSAWAKPVLFSQMDTFAPGEGVAASQADLTWAMDADHATAIIVDFPGAQGIQLAMPLAAAGYRPVPLYNACPQPPGERAVVDVGPIMTELMSFAERLNELRLPPNAPPAFLLDAGRNVAVMTPLPGMFDNRSVSLPNDFPSACLLQSRGIKRVILVQPGEAEPQADLSHTLRRLQDVGIAIFAKAMDDADPPRPIVVRRPGAYRLLWYNLLVKFGLKANPLGGFGGRLPMPSSG